ncbi:hypothetical protein ONZ45_g17209 [Pleurotus djamor]|nr:hypothetical protein ONZ45_g17209 [Pleurotus djamor]
MLPLATGWSDVLDAPYDEVKERFWGKGAQGTLLVAGQSVELHPKFLPFSRGRIFIRQHHLHIREHILRIQTHDPSCRFVLLNGQPGSGKFYSLFYLLVDRLLLGEPVLFSPFSGILYYFSAGGVQCILPQTLSAHDTEHIPPSSWVLLNQDPPQVLARSGMLIIEAANLTANYHQLATELNGKAIHVEKWTRDELVSMLASCSLTSYNPSAADGMIRTWGTAPRDLRHAVLGSNVNHVHLCGALAGLTIDTFTHKLTTVHTLDNTSDDTSYDLLSINCSQVSLHQVVVDLKSTYIQSAVLQMLVPVRLGDAQKLLALCHQHLEAPLLWKLGFELSYICTLCTTNGTINLPIPCEASSLDGTIWVLGPSTPIPPTSPRSALKTARFDPTLVSHHDASLDPSRLYLPTQCNFPFLDGFYLRFDDKTVTVVVLQLTISAIHKGSDKGYAFLERLKAHLLGLANTSIDGLSGQKTVELEYHLVVPAPSSAAKPTIKWKFPKPLPDTIKGKVYVQFVPNKPEIQLLDEEEDETWFGVEEPSTDSLYFSGCHW